MTWWPATVVTAAAPPVVETIAAPVAPASPKPRSRWPLYAGVAAAAVLVPVAVWLWARSGAEDAVPPPSAVATEPAIEAPAVPLETPTPQPALVAVETPPAAAPAARAPSPST